MKKLIFIGACLFISFSVKAQSSYYTIIQGGANLGFANEGYKGSFNGYSAHFIFGKNYSDRAYLGLGIGNERLKGDYQTNDPYHNKVDQIAKYDRQLFPIFIDGRLPFGEFNSSSKIGLMANAGYAPSIAANYDKGFLFKGGFFYLHESLSKVNWTVSAAYGYQELGGNRIDIGRKFQHQQFSVSVGIMLK